MIIKPAELDALDRRILNVLQEDGRLQNVDLAEKVGLSASACLRRVRALEEAHVIDRYVAVLDRTKVGYGMTLFTRVWLKGQDEKTTDNFSAAVRDMPEVTECYMMAGDCDFMLQVAVADLDAYRHFQSTRLGRLKEVQNIKTEIPLQNVKKTLKVIL
jgi:Lrp/AsnC family leucine-responsive transcriptional regulator